MRAPARPTLLALLSVGVLALCACGSTARHRSTSQAGVDPDAVRVIKAWSEALRKGDVTGAARYFALPSELINGGGGGILVSRIHTLQDAVAANASLSCGAVFISAFQQGRFVNALFRLTNRPGEGGGCGSGAGLTARTDFLVRHGRIVEWIRAPLVGPHGTTPGPSGPGSPGQPPSANGPLV